MKKLSHRTTAILQTISAMCFTLAAFFSDQTIMWFLDLALWIIAILAWRKYFKNIKTNLIKSPTN